MHNVRIGRLHPAFFSINPVMVQFDREHTSDGLLLKADEFSLLYDSKGVLYCEDKDVLKDFAAIIRESYGTRHTREGVRDSIDWKTVPKTVKKVKVGVCLLKQDEFSGWEGSINSVWYDDNPPGEVINVYFTFYNTNTTMMDYAQMSVDEIRASKDKDFILRQMIVKKSNSSGLFRQKLDEKIKRVLA